MKITSINDPNFKRAHELWSMFHMERHGTEGIDFSSVSELFAQGFWIELYEEGIITMFYNAKENVYIVMDVYVLPEHRKKGLAKEWLLDLEKLYKPICGALTTNVPPEKQAMYEGLHKSLGVTRIYVDDNDIVYVARG